MERHNEERGNIGLNEDAKEEVADGSVTMAWKSANPLRNGWLDDNDNDDDGFDDHN